MADNVAQSIKDLQKDLAALDKQLLSNNANWNKLGQTIVDSMKRRGLGLDDLFSKMKRQKDVLKLRAIIDRDALMDDVKKLQVAVDKGVKSVKVGGVEITGQRQIEQALEGYKAQLKLVPKTLAEAYDYAVKIANTLGGGKQRQQSEISKQRVKDEKDVQKIQEQTTAALQKRVELEERLKTLKPNGKAWRDVKAELEQVNKEVQNYLARMGSYGTAGARQLKAYEKAGLITNADKQQIALERQQIDLLRQRMQAEQQLNRLLLQRDNAALAGKTVSPRVSDSISRLQERIDVIDKQRLGSYQNFTQTSLQRIEGMWQNHETALTNIKTQGAQSRQRVLDRQTADEQKAIEQQRKLAQRYAEIESLRSKSFGGKKFAELNQSEVAQWRNFSTLLADIKKQMDALEAKHPGSLAKGQSLQSTDALLQQTKDNIRQRDIEAKRQSAAEEKRIEREIAEEAKKAAKEKSDAERQRAELEKQNIRDLQAANKAATQEADRLAKAQAKARSAEAKQTFKRTDAESVANLRKQAEIKQQIAKIDHDRQVRAKTNAQISSQQADAERRSYSALQSELSKLISQQKERERLLRGTTAQASGKIGGYAERLQTQEAQRYRQELEKIERQQQKNKQGLESMLPTIRRLASAFGVAFSVQGLVQFGKKLVETRGQFELQQVAMRSILQNKQLADEIWDKTMQAALQSPFTAMQLTKYTKQLSAYRIETDKLFETTKRLADVSAGLGVDMQRLILAYGQVKATNYLRASEIRQFTEAGVNILGELSEYLSIVENRTITTADVMDMVQKRMVKFEAVEEVFKRLTDQGGIFYDMQYIQSRTVRGQIQKLHDAYDQMLNNIGKANQGTIKRFVELANKIVKNWREWKTVLDTIAWPLIISSVVKFSRGLLTVGSSARLAMGEVKGLELAGTRLRNVLGKTNPWVLLATAVATATFALINHMEAVKAVQKEIDEQNLRLYETGAQMQKYQQTLEENNQAIKSGTLSEDELAKKREENRKILSKLQNDYPQIAKNLEDMRDGTVKNTEALREYNDELERQMTLNNMLGIGGGWFSDTLKQNIQEWETDLSDLKGQLLSVQSNARGGMMKMELKGKQDSPLYAELKKISELDLSDVIKASKEYTDILEHIFSAPMRDARWEIDPNANYISKGVDIYGFRLFQLEQFPHDIKQVSRESNIAFNNFITSLEHYFDSSVSNIKEYSDKISQEYGNDVLRFIANNTDLINQGVLDGNADVVKTIRTVLQSAGVGLTEESRKYYNQLLNERFLYLKYQEALNKTEEKSFFKRVQIAMEARKSYVPIDFFATPASSSTTDPTVEPRDKGEKAKESVSAMISLIKEMNSEYDKLSKSAYGFAQSQDKVTDSFRKSFEQIFRVRGGKGTYINYDDIDFTNKAGAAKALREVFDQIENANAWGKFAKNAKDELLKAISGLEVEADIEVKARIRENFGRQMEEAFGDFQLTLDLEKLNLPHSLLQTMFDIEAVDLAGMRQKLSELSKTLLDENGVMNDDNWKLYNNWLNKIEDKERDMQRQRLKDYSKYLEYQLSERAKLEMEYTKKVAEVQSESAFDDDTRARILRGLQEEYDKKIAKQDWEDFKGSEMYVEMMEDLTHQGTLALEEMRKKLVEIRDNSENLFPRDLKEVVNALQKIDEVVDSRVSPFARIKDLRKDLKDAMKKSGFDNMRDVFAEDKDAKRRYKELKDEYDEIQAVIGAKQQEKEIEEQLGEYRNSSIASLQDLINKKKEEKKSEDKAIALLGERDKSNQQEIESRTQVSNALQGEIDKYESIIKLLKQLEKAQKTIRESSKYGNTDLGLLSVYSDTHKEQKKAAENTTKRIGNITRLWQRLRKAMHEFLEATKEYITQGQQAVSSVYNTIKELGVEVHEIGDQWESLINTLVNGATSIIDAVDKVKDASDSATEATAQAASGQWVKFALTILSVLAQTIGEIAKFRGAIVNKEIREQGEEIADLQAAYDRLERAIEKTFTTATYIGDYNRQIANLRQQISAAEAQLAAAKDRKIQDQSEILGYETAINELYDSIEDLQNEMRETFGGIGESSYRSAAEGFVSAWKDAFLETGNGLKGLQDHFDEFLQDWFVKQGTMQAVANYYSSIWDYVNDIVKDGALPTQSQIDRVREMANEAADRSDAYLQAIAGIFNLGGEGSLSGLAASIQGMTEEQADILAGYWNSVRLYTASIDMNVAAIASALGIGSTPETNPMLNQMRILARNTANINNMLQSVVRWGHPMGQAGIRVFLNQ